VLFFFSPLVTITIFGLGRDLRTSPTPFKRLCELSTGKFDWTKIHFKIKNAKFAGICEKSDIPRQ
jgi:hypothetical protein